MYLLIWIKLFRVFKINVSRLLIKYVLKMWDFLFIKIILIKGLVFDREYFYDIFIYDF